MNKNKQIVLETNSICLDIPLVSKTELSLKKEFVRSFTGGRVSRKNSSTIIKALCDINIKIYYGDRVALIGHNGAGKSTFIRLISGIYEPTKGVLKNFKKVYPMLNKSFLVSDFLTGVDAAKAHYLLLNNNFHGFEEFLKDVKEFSGLGDFISLPIRTYSDGMTSRLIFSLLTYHAHEFLALDEGLGTSDQEFVNKAEIRLEKFINQAGTLVLASHSEALLRKFCKRGVVFSKGGIVYDGGINEALEFYAKQKY